MDFRYPGDGKIVPDGVPNLDNVNVILGVNGAGKTTALKAIALGLIAQMPSTGFVPNSLVRREIQQDYDFGSIILNLYLDEHIYPEYDRHFEARIQKIYSTEELTPMGVIPIGGLQDKVFYDDQSPDYFLIAYGATRRTETGDFEPSSRRKLRSGRYERVAGLFE